MASKKEDLKKRLNTKKSNKKISHSNLNKRKKTNIKKKKNNVNTKKVRKNVKIIQKNNEKEIYAKESSIKKVSLANIKRIIKSIFNKIKSKIKILLIIIFVTIIAIMILFNLKDTPKKIFLTFKEYSVGDKVTLKDDSIWYVIKNTTSDENTFELLSENVLDINNDNNLDTNDKVTFDSSKSCEYNSKKETNIGYFLENEVKEKYDKQFDVKEIRLLNSEEYVNIRKTMNFGYDWEEGNWLANEKIDSWWLETSRYNKIYVVTKRGSYKLSDSNSKNYVRPVIKIEKNNIK